MRKAFLKLGLFKNKYLCMAFILGVIMQVGIVLIPSVREIFRLSMLNNIQWLVVAGVSLLPILIMELQKKINEVLFGKTVYEYKEVRG